MKLVFNHSILVLLIVVLAVSGWAVPTRVKTADDIEKLFHEYVVDFLELSPESGNYRGFSEKIGFPVNNDRFSDYSRDGHRKIFRFYKTYRLRLKSIDFKSLTESQRISAKSLAWYLDSCLEGEKYKHHSYLIDHMFGFHSGLISVMNRHHPLNSPRDAENFIRRLSRFPLIISRLSERIDSREKTGTLAPTFILDKFTDSLKRFIAVEPSKNPLYTSFEFRLKKALPAAPKKREVLLNNAASLLKKSIYPAYQSFINKLALLKEKTVNDAGVWRLPDGDAYYAYCLRRHTTTEMSPEEVHRLGLAEVNRIHKEALILFGKLGIKATSFNAAVGEYIDTFLKGKQGFSYPRTEEGRLMALKDYQGIIDRVKPKLSKYFSRMPKADIKVKRVPVFRQRSMGSHYVRAKLDGSEGGFFYANLFYPPRKPGMEALTFHEAIPGHHFQASIQKESRDVPAFRSLVSFTGYIEGWALYAEKLAYEENFFSDIHGSVGYLNSELIRAVRLVVDTGIHFKRWSREQAFNYMKENVGRGSYNEIDRYCLWPGQACSYKIGELTILKLRKRAKKMLGDRFDIKKFHDVVLNTGGIPLPLLEKQVQKYILRELKQKVN
ncbi:MAG: DUF885 domain-containing protein [bacterium]|nr:DUF885 domain-containing protein [bacterium]